MCLGHGGEKTTNTHWSQAIGANEVASIRHLALALRVMEYPGSFYDLGIRCDPI